MVLATVYLMYKYKWSLHKTFEFLNDRKPDIEMAKGLMKQLQKVEAILKNQIKSDPSTKQITLRQDWTIGQLHHNFQDKSIKDANFERIR